MAATGDPLARGRATIERKPEGLRIVIPPRREWPILIFLLVWLGAWTVGGATTISNLLTGQAEGGAVFSLFWLGGWLFGMIFALSVLGWALLGREVVTMKRDALEVGRVAGPYRQVKRFDRDRIERVRTEPYPGLLRSTFTSPRPGWVAASEMWGLGGGSVIFDYGARTHRFGSKLDDAESRQVADLLRKELGVREQQR